MAKVTKILVVLAVLGGVQTASAYNVKLVLFNWISPSTLEPDGIWKFNYIIERDFVYHLTCYYDLHLYLSGDMVLDTGDFYLGTYEQDIPGNTMIVSFLREVVVEDWSLPPDGEYYVIMYIEPGRWAPPDPDVTDNAFTYGFRIRVNSGISPTYTISGYVEDSAGEGMQGVTLSGLPGAPVTNLEGFYSATVDYGFTGVVTPDAINLTFVPPSRSYSNVKQDLVNEDYTAQLKQCRISGRVRFAGGKPVEGVVVEFEDGAVSVVTDPNGYYGHYVASGWSGSIRPVKETYTFSPALRELTNVLLHTQVNFVAARDGIIYVDPNAPGDNDGTSWTNAFWRLQDALAEAGAGNDIYVAYGTYRPDEGDLSTPGDNYVTFQLVAGATLYGGFPNGGGAWNQRDPSRYPTVLSGRIMGGRAFHVVTGAEGAILDGFVVKDGNAALFGADGRGGGMYLDNVGATVRNCVFRDNYSREFGGAVYAVADSRADSISLTLEDCLFDNNRSGKGGGLFGSRLATARIVDCTFQKNIASNVGGAVYAEYCPTAEFSVSVFSENKARDEGGAVAFGFVDNAKLANCILAGNVSEQSTGGAVSCQDSTIRIANCTIGYNESLFSLNGAGIFASYSSVSVLNSILWGNTAGFSRSLRAQIYSAPQRGAVNYCCVQNLDTSVGGTGNIKTDPNFVDVDGADYHLNLSSPCINGGSPDADYTDQYDIDGDRRLRYGRADIGADEVLGIDGDLQPDGVVNMDDFAILAGFWNKTCRAPGWCNDCDMNQNHRADLADAVVLIEQWLSLDGR